MPQDLPGLYFDSEKNRYFPIKGPISGSKRNGSSEKYENTKSKKKINKTKNLELLKLREVSGSSIVSNRNGKRCNFVQEYEKLQASHPQVWKYQRTDSAVHFALELMHGTAQTAEGLKEALYLLAGCTAGLLRFYGIGNVAQHINIDNECTPISVWQEGIKHKPVESIWRLSYACLPDSRISCIRRIGREPSSFQRALVTTLGSTVPGSVEIVDLSEPFEFSNVTGIQRMLTRVKSCHATIWTADCSRNGRHAVIGTNMGADLIDLETMTSSRICHSTSDVFSQQYDSSGNIVLNGLRNGGIVVVDVREKQSGSSRNLAVLPSIRPMKHQRKFQKNSKFISSLMPSSICSLVALQSDDQYFLGSSMDGSINLFDQRLLQRGAIQTYVGHNNSHSHLQLSVNPTETLALSGGQDGYTRIWSIKTGDLIFEEKVSDSIIYSSCWSLGCFDSNTYEKNHGWGAWLGSFDGLYYMQGS